MTSAQSLRAQSEAPGAAGAGAGMPAAGGPSAAPTASFPYAHINTLPANGAVLVFAPGLPPEALRLGLFEASGRPLVSTVDTPASPYLVLRPSTPLEVGQRYYVEAEAPFGGVTTHTFVATEGWAPSHPEVTTTFEIALETLVTERVCCHDPSGTQPRPCISVGQQRRPVVDQVYSAAGPPPEPTQLLYYVDEASRYFTELPFSLNYHGPTGAFEVCPTLDVIHIPDWEVLLSQQDCGYPTGKLEPEASALSRMEALEVERCPTPPPHLRAEFCQLNAETCQGNEEPVCDGYAALCGPSPEDQPMAGEPPPTQPQTSLTDDEMQDSTADEPARHASWGCGCRTGPGSGAGGSLPLLLLGCLWLLGRARRGA